MSTLSGNASKGEKAKPKFQSLDINSLYKISRGENTEKPTQKSSSGYIKHGMQSLGKVPNARRAPANLPSLKSEHHDSGAAVPLVPPGATGWGKQEPGSAQAPTVQQNGTAQVNAAQTTVQGPPQLTSHQQAIAIPSTNAIPPHSKQPPPQQQQQQQMTIPAGNVATSGGEKLWSAVMAGNQTDNGHPPAYQSPQFQHEFPSLSSGDGGGGPGSRPTGEFAAGGAGVANQPGLSLRPQSEGSWTPGGQRGVDGSMRNGSGVPGAPPQLAGPGGRPAEMLPPQMRGVLPPFMYKGSFPSGPVNNHAHSQMNAMSSTAPSSQNGGRIRPPRLQERDVTPDDLVPRPIVREEELSKLDEFGQDMGWATSDDIDYNQKLAFSDDEDGPVKKDNVRHQQQQQQQQQHATSAQPTKSQDVARSERQTPPKHWGRSDSYRGRQSDDDDAMMAVKQHQKVLNKTIILAKQRKEMEEKRYNEETWQKSQKKLQELDEKSRERRDRNRESEVGTISPSAVPPKPINHVDIPLPDFQKDKDQKVPKEDNNLSSGFRQLTQIEGKSFARKPQPLERDHRDQNGPSFSRQFQNDMPPRFMKQQHRTNGPSSQPAYASHYDSNKWSRSARPDSPSDDRRGDFKRLNSEDSYRSSHHSQSEQPKQSYGEDTHGKRDDDKWQQQKERHFEDRRSQEKQFERPQRPDSRDSHTSHTSQGSNRRSRDSDFKESMGSWNEDIEADYAAKPEKEEKRVTTGPALVPPPITRDRIEADDGNDTRNLTQLKKGEMPKRVVEITKKDTATDKPTEELKEDKTKDPPVHDEFKDRQSGRNPPNRGFSQTKSWGSSSSSSDFYSRGPPPPSSSTRGAKRPTSRGHKPGSREFYGTDSDGSTTDTYSAESKDGKPRKMLADKDDKNRDNKREKSSSDLRKPQQDNGRKENGNYVPKGEPSRHGRGGGSSNFRGSRMSGMGKRFDGYGPPPSKSPFGHHDDKKDEVAAESTPSTDKTKQNQEALAAGIIGKSRQESFAEDKSGKFRSKPENRRNKSKGRRDELDGSDSDKRQPIGGRSASQRGPANPSRAAPDRRDRSHYLARGAPIDKDNKPKRGDALAGAISDISLKDDGKDSKESSDGNDMDGFQEVKNKKTVKESGKPKDEKKGGAPSTKPVDSNKDAKQLPDKKQPSGKPATALTAQQIQSIPPLMSTPVNPPQMLPAQTKTQYDQRSNNRQTKLAPRFAKQKMQKQMQQQQQQQQMMNDVGDVGKAPPQSHHVYGSTQASSAWDKPLSSQLRSVEHESNGMLSVTLDASNAEASGASSSVGEKLLGKPALTEKNLLDGATPPVNTIIFENTNFKSGPGVRAASRNSVPGDKQPTTAPSRSKLDDGGGGGGGGGGNVESDVFAKPINDLLQKATDGTKSDAIQMQSVFKEESDMKLDFLGADLTHLTDDKSTKSICISKSIASVNSTIYNADSLNMKIASVKKVWERSEQESEESNGGLAFGTPLDNAFKGSDAQDETHHEGFSPGSNPASSTTNVCKVKPTQQVSSATGQTASSAAQQLHSAIVGHPMLLGTPLSPPPPPLPAAAVGVSLGPQAYATNQHLAGFATAAPGQGVAAAGSAQYGIPAIPSPPTVLFNSTQQLQSGLYGAFLPTADQTGVLGGQGHGRAGAFGQYPGAGAYHNLGQPTNSHYNTQSVYLPTAPHPPPTAQAPPELYSSLNSFRLSGHFGQNQPLNNPTTVLISSTSNSLMSASVKPSSQSISAIGTKAGGVGQAYQQQSQQGQQVYMAYEPALQAANYLPGAGVMQRAPAGPPVQNSVVPGLQPSSSYYSGSTGAQTGFYQQQANSTLQSGPQMPQHQAGYGLQGNVFNTHNQSHTNTGLQSSFPYISTPLQIALAQQYRSVQNPYLKNVGGPAQQLSGDQQAQQVSGGQRPQQLKSPSSQEVLSSVFNPVSQIPSPKSRPNNKHPPQQSSPTTQRKYFYQGVGNQQQNNMQQRYPTPIQRPTNFQSHNMNSVQNNGPNTNQKHNKNHPSKAPNRQYYGGQSNNQIEKSEETKGSDGSGPKPNASDISKEGLKEDATSVLKEQ